MDAAKQRLLLRYLISSPDLFAVTNAIIRPEYFDPEVRKATKFIQTYYEEYRALPDTDQIYAETSLEIVPTNVQGDKYAYCVTEVEQFCKRKAMEHAVLQSVALIEKEDYGSVETLIRNAVTVGITKSLGLDYYEDPLTRLERLRNTALPISTGWRAVDDVCGGGWNRGDLVIVSANSGGGKSVTMENWADRMNNQGYNGVYFSFELNEDLISKRHDSIVSGIQQAEVLMRYKEVAAAVVNARSSKGHLQIKHMNSPTPNELRAYLKEYELKFKRRPDFIVVDYIAGMRADERVDANDVYTKDKFVSEALRNIASDYNAIVMTASQQNRDAIDKLELNQGNIAGGISKVDTCDVYISIIMTDAMRAAGDIIFQFLKTRSSDGVGKNAHLAWDPKTLRISDSTKDNAISLKSEGSRTSGVMLDKSPMNSFNKGGDQPSQSKKPARPISSSLVDLIDND